MKAITLNVLRWFIAVFVFVPGSAVAAVVLVDGFDSDTTDLAAQSQWEASYCPDGWRTDLNGGVISALDDSCGQCSCTFLVQSDGVNHCIDSQPLDNHIQRGDVNWQNYVYSVRFKNGDDDTMGVLFRYVNSANFYLFFLVQHSAPDASGCASEFSGARLIRVRDSVGTLLKEVAGLTYTVGQEHAIRITVEGRHVKVEFDHDGNGAFGPNEVFFDQDDDAQAHIPAGKIGLYNYNNGATESDGQPAPCMNGECWFDDVKVELLPPNNVNCGPVGWEGMCQGNSLSWCDKSGQLKTENCGAGSCCRYASELGYYTCLPGAFCDQCTNGCQEGETGCSSNLSHTMACGQGDADGCKEPVYTICPASTTCNPQTKICEAACAPDCAGLECGNDGCGGSCGQCGEGQDCVAGSCQGNEPGPMGAPCDVATDCLTMMCVATDDGPLCSKACTGDASCPTGFVCEDVQVQGATIQACVPSGECLPDCTGKVCGSDGCEGSCGQCDSGFSCKGGACKATAGATCKDGQDCASGLCISFQSGTFCSSPCSTDDGCPEGWSCQPWIQASTPNICAPKSSMVAHDTCGEIASCIDSCPPGNDSCVSSCFFFGHGDAQAEYSELVICMQSVCFANCGDDNSCLSDCLLDECFQPFAACFPGEMTCDDAVDCIGGCGGGSACVDGCYADAYPSSKKQLNALLDCLAELCETPTGDCFNEAIEETCADAWEACQAACQPLCDGLECGDDGCGGDCGDCPPDQVCDIGQCVVDCQPACDGKECGDDGCQGQCGDCQAPYTCVAGTCAAPGDCVPEAKKQCVGDELFWFDSCGEQGAQVQACALGCADGACLTPATGDTVGGDGGSSNTDDAVVLSASKSSGGCTAAAQPQPVLLWPVVLLIAGLLWTRRSQHA